MSLKSRIGAGLRRLVSPFVNDLVRELELRQETSPQVKTPQRLLFHYYRSRTGEDLPGLKAAGFRNFSQFDEDGKLLYIFAVMGVDRGTFVDIGSGDGINSNCANLALNFGWTGAFIDGDPANIDRGRAFYEGHADSWLFPPAFTLARVTRENIDAILKEAGAQGEVDLLSVDIDGNDYWVWDAISAITPKVVIIETHIEYGLRSVVVPYDENFSYPGEHPDYFGASPLAMTKLAARKGYRLVGANDYGFNTIFVRRGLEEETLPGVPVEQLLSHPRNKARATVFDAVKDLEFLEV